MLKNDYWEFERFFAVSEYIYFENAKIPLNDDCMFAYPIILDDLL